MVNLGQYGLSGLSKKLALTTGAIPTIKPPDEDARAVSKSNRSLTLTII